MPEEPAMDSYQPQADVSHVIAQLPRFLALFLLQQIKRVFVRKSLKLYWMNHIELHILISPTTLLSPSYHNRLNFRLSGAVVRCHGSDCII